MEAPLVREVPYLDPLDAYGAFAGEPYALLLDARAPGKDDRALAGRHAFVAADPFRTIGCEGASVRVAGKDVPGDPFRVLQRILAEQGRSESVAGLPPFQGGAAGYFGYELNRHLERLPEGPDDAFRVPDMMVGLYDLVLAIDVARRRAWIVSSGRPATTPRSRRRRAEARAERLAATLASRRALPPSPPDAREVPDLEWRSNFASRAAYESAVARVVELIHAGDVFQVNLSQRFRTRLPPGLDPLSCYRRLRRISAAPFGAFLDFGEMRVASNSPERFLRVVGERVETRPIKGTRPRGATPAEDRALAGELLASEKDRAENVMIVDLLRNDLSRVCRDHSVRVPALCALESFATVHHLVSTVEARLSPGSDAMDLLRAAFPGGSITGAPKVRAMEIIAALEPSRRGPYCGAIGYVGFDGTMDTSVAIRTITFRGRDAVFQVGGGVVADSEPAAEYDETLAKARALFACFEPREEVAPT